MAEFTHKELKTARESRKIKKWQLAQELGVSEDTIYRWEAGLQRPDPDDVGNIERILEVPGLWHRWMMSHYDSYRERNMSVPNLDHLLADVMRTKHEMFDVISLFDEIERDAVDGIMNKPETWQKFRQELLEAKAAMQLMADKIPHDNDDHKVG